MSLTAAAAVLLMGSAVPEAAAVAPAEQVQAVVEASPATTPSEPAQAVMAATVQAGTASPSPPVAAPVPSGVPDEAAQQAPENIAGQGAETADTATHGADIVVTRRKPPPPGDPMERVNAEAFKAVQAVDKAVLQPVATAYNEGLPRPVRQGLRNFFRNLNEPAVFVAYLLQLKPGKAAETAGRFAINTTLGVGGLIDTAKRKPFNLPYRPNGLANVMGYYGIGPGPFMYLPIVGPTTVRDLIGDTIDNLLLVPTLVGKPLNKPEVALPMSVVRQLGERAAFDTEINRIRKTENPYATYRDLYLRQRQAEIDALRGRVTPDVVPVYGPGMPTADGKNQSTEAAPETVPPASVSEPAPATTPAGPEATGQGTVPDQVPTLPEGTAQPQTKP